MNQSTDNQKPERKDLQNIQFQNVWLLERFDERKDFELAASEVAQRDLIRYYCLLNLAFSFVSLSVEEFHVLCQITQGQPLSFCNYPEFNEAFEHGVASVQAELMSGLYYYRSLIEESREVGPFNRMMLQAETSSGVDLNVLIEKVSNWSFLEAFAVADLIERSFYMDEETLSNLLQRFQPKVSVRQLQAPNN